MGAVLLLGPCTAGRCEIEWRGRPASSDEEGTLKRAKRELMLNSATLVDTRHGSELPRAGAPPPWVDKTYGGLPPELRTVVGIIEAESAYSAQRRRRNSRGWLARTLLIAQERREGNKTA